MMRLTNAAFCRIPATLAGIIHRSPSRVPIASIPLSAGRSGQSGKPNAFGHFHQPSLQEEELITNRELQLQAGW